MDFLPLLEKLLPLYALIALGYIAGKKLNISSQSIARLVIYIIVPVAFFGYIARLEPSPAIIFLPLLIWAVSAAVLGITWCLARLVFNDSHVNLSAATAAGVNSGYFGIPVFIMLFGEQNLGIYMLAVLGFALNEVTLVYYTLARGHYTWRASLKRLFSLPAFYASIAGIIFAFMGWHLPTPVLDFVGQFRSCYVVLGMLMLGLGLSQIQVWGFSWSYVGLSFLGRFGIGTLLIAALIWINAHSGFWLTIPMRQSLWLLCVLPLANNIVAYTTDLNLHPDQAAAAVMLSTLLSAVLILVAAPWLLQIQ